VEQKKNELEILFPNNKIKLAGEELPLLPFCFGDWVAVIEKSSGLIELVLDALAEYGEGVLDVKAENGQLKLNPKTIMFAMKVLSHGGEAIYEILAIAIRKPVVWVKALEGMDGFTLLIGAWLTNKDFFTSQVVPTFQKNLMQEIEEAVTGLPGAKSRKRSSKAGIA